MTLIRRASSGYESECVSDSWREEAGDRCTKVLSLARMRCRMALSIFFCPTSNSSGCMLDDHGIPSSSLFLSSSPSSLNRKRKLGQPKLLVEQGLLHFAELAFHFLLQTALLVPSSVELCFAVKIEQKAVREVALEQFLLLFDVESVDLAPTAGQTALSDSRLPCTGSCCGVPC